MRILIVDGQGGGVGRMLLEELLAQKKDLDIIVVGSNSTATANMLKGFNVSGATGENAVVFNSNKVDIIMGPIGIVMPNAMLGEITPKMAEAISSSPARIILIPMNRCHAVIVGIQDKKRKEYIKEAIAEALA